MVAGFPVGMNKEYTIDTNENDKSRWQIVKDTFGGASSVHNCYGLGQAQCLDIKPNGQKGDGYRLKDTMMMYEPTVYELTHPVSNQKEEQESTKEDD